MKIFSVPVHIFRHDKLNHCASCSCRAEKQLIAIEYVTVAARCETVKEAQDAATQHVYNSTPWSDRRREDYGRYTFEASDPLPMKTNVVVS